MFDVSILLLFRNFKGCHVSKDAEVADFLNLLRQSFNAALNASLKSLGCAEAEQWIEKMHQVWEDLKRMIMKTACCQEPCCFSFSCLENQLHIQFFVPCEANITPNHASYAMLIQGS